MGLFSQEANHLPFSLIGAGGPYALVASDAVVIGWVKEEVITMVEGVSLYIFCIYKLSFTLFKITGVI